MEYSKSKDTNYFHLFRTSTESYFAWTYPFNSNYKFSCGKIFLNQWPHHAFMPLFLRARSIYERSLDVDHRNITIWLKYAEMEMKWEQINLKFIK